MPNILKASSRQKRGTGARRRVLPSAMVLRNWQEFLRLDNNKNELFLFLSEQVVRTTIEGKQIVVTQGEEVLCSSPATRSKLSPRSHEEVDTRMMVHIVDAVQDGHQSVMIRSTHTNVVVSSCCCCCNFRLKEIMGVLWNKKNPQDPTGTSLCKGDLVHLSQSVSPSSMP